MKVLKIILGLLLAISTFTGVVVSAEETGYQGEVEGQVIYNKKEIKDLKQLRKRAENRITDVENPPVLNDSEFYKIDKKNPENQKKIKIKQIHTTQKLKTIKTKNEEIVTLYATTSFMDIPEDELIESQTEENEALGFIAPIWNKLNTSLGVIKASAASKKETLNGTSVNSYSTIYWAERGSGTSKEFRLTSASGGWTILDNQVSISNRTVRLGQSNNVTPDYKPTGFTYSYSAPTNWPWLNYNCSVCFVGST